MRKIFQNFFAGIITLLITQTALANSEFKVSYGYLYVPLNHNIPHSIKIQIAYAKIENPRTKEKTPFIYLSGGPGSGAVRFANIYKTEGRLPDFARLALEHGPIYFIDQRGSGNSEPNLRCNASEVAADFNGGGYRDYLELSKEIVEYCRNRFLNFDQTARALNSVESAKDIERLRQEISAEKVILLGESYGTHLSFSYMRLFGDHVEKAALSLVEGPDHTLKLPRQFDRAILRIDEHREKQKKPAIYPQIAEWIASFNNRQKATLDPSESDLQISDKHSLSLFEFRLFLRLVIWGSSTERIYQALQKRDYQKVKQWVVNRFKRGYFNSMFYAMDCSSGVSKNRLERIKAQNEDSLLGQAMNFPFPQICETLNIEPLSDDFRSPLYTDIPTILYSGSLDYKTPVSNALEIAENFENVILVNDEDGYHNFCRKPHCLIKLNDFLENGVSR